MKKKTKVQFLLVTIIVLIGLFLRTYRISEFLTFLGDEGRDVRIVRDLVTEGNLVFIGPQTSIGNMYLGPLYYYLIAPSLWLAGLSPVGPAVMNAILGSLTILLVWFVGKKWFGELAGYISALFYALSPVAIIYSRSSWNPNPTPLFALISVYFLYLVWQKKEYKWLPYIGISFAFALQMHYLSLLLVPLIGLYWLFELKSVYKDKVLKTLFIKKTFLAILFFLILMSPLVLFDLKHQGMNFNAFKAFFTDRQTTVNLNPARSDRFIPVIITTVTDLILARQKLYSGLVAIVILFLSIFSYYKSNNKPALKVLFSWIIISVLGLGLYKQHVYIHYLGFVYPAIYLLLGVVLSSLISKERYVIKAIGVLGLLFLVYLNIKYSPVRENPNNQLKTTEAAVDLIIKESGSKPFNFGLIAKQNYDESYRYFFENKSAQMVRGEVAITEQLFVICEDGDKCQPEGNPAFQVAIFGPASVSAEWNLQHLKIYRLIHKK